MPRFITVALNAIKTPTNFMTNKYKIPETANDMVSEPVASACAQYASGLHSEMMLQQSAPSETLQDIVEYIRLCTKQENIKRSFDALFMAWWHETCIYSGPSLCYDNDNYRKIKAMGTDVVPLIEAKATTTPAYMHRHIQWLKSMLI